MTTSTQSRTTAAEWLGAHRAHAGVGAFLLFFFVVAFAGLEREDLLVTVMQGLSVGAITFLVASGLSLILGLMDVFNLAHGEFFMLGAYIGWTVYTRFDTFVDLLVPIALVVAPFLLGPLWRKLGKFVPEARQRTAGWIMVVVGLGLLFMAIGKFPLVIWDAEDFARTPTNFSVQVDLGTLAPLEAEPFEWPAPVAFAAVIIAGSLLALGKQALSTRRATATTLKSSSLAGAVGLIAGAVVLTAVKAPLNEWAFGLSTTWRFFFAMGVAVAAGVVLGIVVEIALIRPLYDRPMYQLMITLGLGFILIELVREVWGKPQFTMARPAAFAGTGPGCPAEGFGGFFSGCSTVEVFGGRLRVYNEGFVVLVGVLVLLGITILLRRSRIGMIIRAGVQDPSMVEALGINARRVFTMVFALGSGLATLGGVLAAPSIGLDPGMGAVFLLGAIVALAVGGLTSFPGAAAGAVLVGLMQQVIIRYGQRGVDLPFLAEPFKPSPTVVPAAALLLMVVVLLVLPGGLFGRKDH